MAGDAAQTAANRINPSEEQLNQIDHPADDNTWHDVPDTGNLKNQGKGMFNKYKPFSRSDMKDAAGDATQTAHPGDSRDPADAANRAADDTQYGESSGMDAQQGARAGAQSLINKAKDNFPDDAQDNMRETTNKTKAQTRDYLRKQMPQERREQTIWRLKKMVTEIQGHQDCKKLQSSYTRHC